ncbi:MAG: hypothetical protein COZ18_09595 [Flexibacter sp. CG_4_10_14_3_um_filter_32_15]|nr:MAG: hypothetical protein COZ18_09595 [Flexibacter sp. CG_4_10_14_3_um_filter_32_15]
MKKEHFFILLFLLNFFSVYSQNIYILQDKKKEGIDNFEILIDKDYTFEQILTDSTLVFQENPDYYKPQTEEYCWFRFSIKNPSVYSKEIYLYLVPYIDNILYYYNFEEEKWKTKQSGLAITDLKREKGVFCIYLPSKSTNTFYIKSKVTELNNQEYPTYLFINIDAKKTHEDNEQFVVVSWLVATVAMLLFFVYNLYIYFVFRDTTYLYYLIIVGGAILYITAFSDIFNFVAPFSFHNIQVQPNGNLYSYSTRDVISFIFIWMILFGYIQFTRSYLKLDIYNALWDTLLKYTAYFFSCITLLFIVITSFKSINVYIWIALLNNLAAGLIVLLILFAGVVSYRSGYKSARYFLLANTFPLLGIFTVAIYLFIYEYNVKPIQLVPHIALTLQTVSFAIALVARVNLIKDELKEKQIEAQKLEAENGEILSRNRYIELENEHIISEIVQEINQKADLQAKLEANQRELTANSLYLYQKNELLANLQKQIENLSYKDTTTQNREGIREIKSTIKNDIQLESDWDNFKVHFEEVHPNFFKELNEKYPTLTKNEVRLSAYYHLNMTAKEIATLLNINPTSVHRAKSRLNKKMEAIDKEQ